MINSMVAKVLSMLLSDYFENPEKLTIKQLLTGTVTLHNLKIKESLLSYLMLPMKLAYGMVRELEITIPWLSLATKPIMVEVKDVVLVYLLTSTNEWNATELNSNWKDFKDIETLKEKSINIFLDSNTLGSKWNAIMHRFLRNAILSFHNIDFLFYNTFFGDNPFIFGFKCMTAYNIKCNPEWEPLEKSFSTNTAYTTDYSTSNGPDSDLQVHENSSSLGSSGCYEQGGIKNDYANTESDKKLEKLMENGILTYNLFICENTMLYYRGITENDEIDFKDKPIGDVQKWIRDSSDINSIIYRRESFQLRYRACNGPINDEILNILACDSMLAPNIKTSFSEYSGTYSVNEQIDQIRSMINTDRINEELSSVTDKSDIILESKLEDPKKRKSLLSRIFSRKKDEASDQVTVEEPPKYQTNLEIYQNIYKAVENKFLMRIRDSRVYPNASITVIFPRLITELSNEILKACDSLFKYIYMYQDVCFIGLDRLDSCKIPPILEIEKYKKEFRSMAYGLKFDYAYMNTFYEKYSIKFIKKLNIVLLEDLAMQIFTLYENMSNWDNFKRKMFSSCFTDNSRFFKQKTPLSKKENDILSMYRNKFLIEIMPWYSVHVILRDINLSVEVDDGVLDFTSDNLLVGLTSGVKTMSYDVFIENCLLRTDFKTSLLKNIIQSGSYIASDSVQSEEESTADTTLVLSKRSKGVKSRALANKIFSAPLTKDTGENEFLKCAGFLLSFDTGDTKPRIDVEAFGSWMISISIEVIKRLIEVVNYVCQPYSFDAYIQSSKFQPQVMHILGLGDVVYSDVFCDIPPAGADNPEWAELPTSPSRIEDEIQLTDSENILSILAQDISFEEEKISMVDINTVRSNIVLLFITGNTTCDMQAPFLFFDFGNIHSLATVDVSEEEDSCSRQLHGAEFQGLNLTLFKSIYSILEDDDGRIEDLFRIGNPIDVIRLRCRESHSSQKILPPASATLQLHRHSDERPPFSLDMIGAGPLVFNVSHDFIHTIKQIGDDINAIFNLNTTSSGNAYYHSICLNWSTILVRFWERSSHSSTNSSGEAEFKNVKYVEKITQNDEKYINLGCHGITFRHLSSVMDIICDINVNYHDELDVSISDLNFLSNDFDFGRFFGLVKKSGFSQTTTTSSESSLIKMNINVRNSLLSYQYEDYCVEVYFDFYFFIYPYENTNDWSCNINLFIRSMYLIGDGDKVQISKALRCNVRALQLQDVLNLDLNFDPMILNLDPMIFSLSCGGDSTSNDTSMMESVLSILNSRRIKFSQNLSNLQVKFDVCDRYYLLVCEYLRVELDTCEISLPKSLKSGKAVNKSSKAKLAHSSSTPIGDLSSLIYIDSEDADSILEPLTLNGVITFRRKEFCMDLYTSWANVNLRFSNFQNPLTGNPILTNSLGIPIYLTGSAASSLTLIPNDSSFELSGFDSGFKIVILLFEHIFEIELARVDFQVKELRFNFPKSGRSCDAIIPIAISTTSGPPIRVEISSTLSIRNSTDYKLAVYSTPLVTEFTCFLNCQTASTPRNIRYDFNSEAMFNRVLELDPGMTRRIPLPWLLNRSLIARALTTYGLGPCPESYYTSTEVEDIKFSLWTNHMPASQLDFARFYDTNSDLSQHIANVSSLKSIYRHQRRDAHSHHFGSKLLQLSNNIFISSEIVYRKHAFMPHYNFEVVLSPPMTIRNLLPHRCLIRISGDTAELKPSEDCGIYNGSTGFSIEIQMPYYEEYVIYRSKIISVGDLRIFDSERVIEFFIYAHGRGDRVLPPIIRCCVSVSAPVFGLLDLSADESLSRNVSVYAPHWIFNNQPLPVVVKSDYNRQCLRPGECSIFGLSFYESMEFGRENLSMTRDNGRFSRPCKLDSLKSFTQVYIPPSKTDSARWLSVVSRPAPPPFQRSTLTIIESRFTLVNNLSHPVYIVQATHTSVQRPFLVVPGASIAYHPSGKARDVKKLSCYFTLLEPLSYSIPSTKSNNEKPLSVLGEVVKNPRAYLSGVVPSIDCDEGGIALSSTQTLSKQSEERGFNEYWMNLWTRRGQKLQLDVLHPNSPKLRILFNINRFRRLRRGGKVVARKGLAIGRAQEPSLAVKHAEVICPGGVQFIHKDFEGISRRDNMLSMVGRPMGDDQIRLRQSKLISITGSLYPHIHITPSTASLYLADLNFACRVDLQFRQAYRRQRLRPSPRPDVLHHTTPRTTTNNNTTTTTNTTTRRSSIQIGKHAKPKRVKQVMPSKFNQCRTCLIDVKTQIDGKMSQIELVNAQICKYRIRNKTDYKIYFSEPLGDPCLLCPHTSIPFGWSSGLAEFQGKLRVMISSQSTKPYTFTCNITKLKIHAILPCISNRGGVSTRSFLIAATLVKNRIRTLVFTSVLAQRVIEHVHSENILSLRKGSVALDRLYSYLQNRSTVKRSIGSLSLQLNVAGLGIAIAPPNSAIQNVQELPLYCFILPLQITYCYSRVHSLRLLLGEISIDAFDSPLIRQSKYSDYWWKKWSKLPGFMRPLLRKSHERVSQVERQILDSTWQKWDKRRLMEFQKSMVRFYISGNFEKRPVFLSHLVMAIEPLDVVINTRILKTINSMQSQSTPALESPPKESGLLYLEYFYITPLKAYVSLTSSNDIIERTSVSNGSVLNYLNSIVEDISETPISFHPTFQTNIFTSGQRLLEDSSTSYLRQLVRQSAKTLGAFNLIGNPIGLFRRIHYGLCELISALLRIFSFKIHEFPFHLIKGVLVFVLITICSLLDSCALCLKSIHSFCEHLSYYNANVALDLLPIPLNRRALFEPTGLIDTITHGIHGSLMVLTGSLIEPFALIYSSCARFIRRIPTFFTKCKSSSGWKSTIDKRVTSRMLLKIASFVTLGPPMSIVLLAKSFIRGVSCTLSHVARVADLKAEPMGRLSISGTLLSQYDFHVCNATKVLNQALAPSLSNLCISSVYASSDVDMLVVTDAFLFQINESRICFVCEKDSIYRINLVGDAMIIYFTSHLKLKMHMDVKKFMKQRHVEVNEKNTRHFYKINNKNKGEAKKMFEALGHIVIVSKNKTIV